MDFLKDLIRRCYYAVLWALIVVYFGDRMLTAYQEGNTEKLLGYTLIIVGAMFVGLVAAFAVTLSQYKQRQDRNRNGNHDKEKEES